MIYLDNASTTPCLKESAEIVKNALVEDFFNPSAKYMQAFSASKKLEECRQTILSILNAKPAEFDVVFTGSATEANNLVLNSSLSKHKINMISIGEHSSIYEPSHKYMNQGYKIIELALNEDGQVDLEDFSEKMSESVTFISCMLVSNETGAINDISSMVKIARKINPSVLIHVDAVQAFCKININLNSLGVDYLTISSHKIEGPKGVGALIYRKKLKLEPQIIGGGQEKGKRSGTENLPSILGFVNSAKRLYSDLEQNFNNVKKFKQDLINALLDKSTKNKLKLIINGKIESSSPYILSCGILGVKGEVLLRMAEQKGLLIGTGSACNSKLSGNRVLSAMGRKQNEIDSNIRLSFSANTLKEDPEEIAEIIISNAKKMC